MQHEIIDFHMHPYLDAEHNVCKYDKSISPESIGADLARAGISRFCGSVVPFGADTWAKFHACNMAAMQLRDMYSGTYIPGITIHPDYVRESCEELETMYSQGIRLIGELVPNTNGNWSYVCKGALEIFDFAQDLGMTVSIHSTDMAEIFTLCRTFPHLNIVAAHPGEYDRYMQHLERMQSCPNAYLDICGTGLFRNRMLSYGVNLLGAERFLFGTDYPVCNPAMQVAGVEWEIDSINDLEAIFSKNAKRLLNLA